MSLIEFFSHNTRELLALTFEHLFLVAVSTGIAILIGVILGMLLAGLDQTVVGTAHPQITVKNACVCSLLHMCW